MSKSGQREKSAFRQGQIDRIVLNEMDNYPFSEIMKKKRMKKMYNQRFPTNRLSNMYGSYWFRGWNNYNEKLNTLTP